VELEKMGKIEKKELKFEIGKKELKSRFYAVGITPKVIKDFDIKVGESFVGDGAEVAHVDLLIGNKQGPVGDAYAKSLANPSEGKEALQVILEPNMQVKPPTVMIPTVNVGSLRHASLTYGPAQAAVGKAIMDSVNDGFIPEDAVNSLMIIANVFVHPTASRRKRVFINNYKATRNAMRKAIEGRPTAEEAIKNKDNARHPLRNDP
jgi:5,6,7,8-tetrahydromethanopterin hydro-lyase